MLSTRPKMSSSWFSTFSLVHIYTNTYYIYIYIFYYINCIFFTWDIGTKSSMKMCTGALAIFAFTQIWLYLKGILIIYFLCNCGSKSSTLQNLWSVSSIGWQQSMGVLYGVSAKYVSRYIFVSFHCIWEQCICIGKVSIDMHCRYDTFFTLRCMHFSTTVKGKGFNYLSVYKSW